MADLLTTSQVADMFGISAATVRQTILRGSIKAQKIEKVWYIEHDEAERFWGKKVQEEEDTKIALDLLYSLRDGRTDILFEMFPDLEEELCDPPPKPPDDGGKLAEALRRIDILEQAFLAGNVAPPPVQMTPPTNAPAFAGTKTNGKSDGNAANNLLASLDNF